MTRFTDDEDWTRPLVARVGLLSPEFTELLRRAEVEMEAELAKLVTPEAIQRLREMKLEAMRRLIEGDKP